MGYLIPMNTLKRLNYNINPLFFMSFYKLFNKGYFLILVPPKVLTLGKNNAKKNLSLKISYSYLGSHLAIPISRYLLGILGNLASSFREEGVKDYRNFKKKTIS